MGDMGPLRPSARRDFAPEPAEDDTFVQNKVPVAYLTYKVSHMLGFAAP